VNGSLSTWYKNGTPVNEGDTYHVTLQVGKHNITVSVTNENNDSVSHQWIVDVTNHPLTQSFNSETTNFEQVTDLQGVHDVVLANQNGRITFTSPLDLSMVPVLDGYVSIENGKVQVNTSHYPQLNRSSWIEMRNLTLTSPVILVTAGNGFVECTYCTNLTYVNNILVCYVPHYSAYLAVENNTPGPPEFTIKKMKINIDGKSQSVEDGDEIEALAGTYLELKVSIENPFDINLENIEIEYDFEDIKDGDLDLNTLEPGEDDEKTIKLVIPADTKTGEYEFEITVTGVDVKGTRHKTTEEFEIKITEKESTVIHEDPSGIKEETLRTAKKTLQMPKITPPKSKLTVPKQERQPNILVIILVPVSLIIVLIVLLLFYSR
jgi:hypothetical protein